MTRLTDLAEQLLSSTGSPRAEPPAGASDLAAVARAEVERWQAAHPDRAAELEVTTGETVDVRVDRQSLERVVTNLLANALAHGAPPVRIGVRREGSYAVLCVADDGPGLPPDLLAQVTRRFSRAPEARSRPGAGLGLSLVEHLVVRAGGELRLCHDGHHASTGTVADVGCAHDDRMTVTVLLPEASARLHRPFILGFLRLCA